MSTLQRPILHESKGLGSSISKKSISLYPNGQSAERPQMNFKYSFSSNLLAILEALSIGGLEGFWQAFHPLSDGVHMEAHVWPQGHRGRS